MSIVRSIAHDRTQQCGHAEMSSLATHPILHVSVQRPQLIATGGRTRRFGGRVIHGRYFHAARRQAAGPLLARVRLVFVQPAADIAVTFAVFVVATAAVLAAFQILPASRAFPAPNVFFAYQVRWRAAACTAGRATTGAPEARGRHVATH